MRFGCAILAFQISADGCRGGVLRSAPEIGDRRAKRCLCCLGALRKAGDLSLHVITERFSALHLQCASILFDSGGKGDLKSIEAALRLDCRGFDGVFRGQRFQE